METVSGGVYDLRTPTGRMQARIVGSVARFESEHKGERQRAKADELAACGLPPGGGVCDSAFGGSSRNEITARADSFMTLSRRLSPMDG